MRLGGGDPKAATEPRPEPAPPSPRPDFDWIRRAWQASTGN
jgi:hypothetical protein